MRELTNHEKNIIEEHGVVVGNILNKDGSKKKMPNEEKIKYYNWLNACDSISDNGFFVKLLFTKISEEEIVKIDGLVAWNDRLGGFSINGKIDLILNAITVNIYLDNKDNFETKRISINNLERKKMK